MSQVSVSQVQVRRERPRWISVVAALAVSAAVLAPCWWNERIEAGDVSSHTYNAWLANHLAQLHGLWLARQSTNMLYDVLLANACRWFGYATGERVAVSVVALLGFWGMFALTGTRGWRWYLAPVIAMLTYSWTFHMGLMNYCLAEGLSALALAAWMRRGMRGTVFAVPLLVLAWMAHMLPVLVVLACGGYAWLHGRLRQRERLLLLVSVVAALVLMRQVLTTRYVVLLPTLNLRTILGVNQLVIYTIFPYQWIGFATVLLLWVSALVCGRTRLREVALSAPMQLAMIFTAATVTLPTAMQGFSSSVSLVVERLTIVMPLCACVLLAWERPGRVVKAAFAVLAVGFFLVLWRHGRVMNEIDDAITAAVRQAPANSRVVELMPYGDNTSTILHMVDRACVDHCFSYANYEPGCGQFRLRAERGNGIVADNYPWSVAMQIGQYVVQRRDVPLYEVYLCDRVATRFCVRELQAGQGLDAP